jgi:hypothetical protein
MLSSATLSLTGEHSWSIWLRRDSITGADMYPVQIGSQQLTNQLLVLGFQGLNNVFRYSFRGNALDTPGQNIEIGTWVHFCGTFQISANGVTGSNIRKIFKNGNQVATDTQSSILSATGPIRLGSWSGAAGNTLIGALDEFRVWSRWLTNVEAAATYENTFILNNLECYYKFNEASGLIYDSSGEDRTLTVYGAPTFEADTSNCFSFPPLSTCPAGTNDDGKQMNRQVI